MGTIDITKLQPSTIIAAFAIVIACFIALGCVMPNIVKAFNSIKSVFTFFNKKSVEKKEMIQAIENSKKNAIELNEKIDRLTECLNKFIVESRDSDRKMQDNITSISNRIDQDEIDRIRTRILQFANELKTQPQKKHSIDEFQHVISQNEKYHQILEPKGLKNGVIDVEYDFILEKYREACDNGTLIHEDDTYV